MQDYLTRYGAGVLAEKIQKFWTERGYAGIRVERSEIKGIFDHFQVRSNIGRDGFPPKKIA